VTVGARPRRPWHGKKLLENRVVTDSAAWHALSSADVRSRLDVPAQGLTAAEARRRLALHGPNQLQAAARVSPWMLLAAQFKNVLILILLGATVVSAAVGHGLEAAVIALIVLFAILLGFVQEFRAERAIEALRALAAPTATVVRDGRAVSLAAAELVPGDLLQIKAGDRVPADARVVESVNLRVEEAALTGESAPVEKQTQPLVDATPLAERTNLLFAGTSVAYGRGLAVAVATGMQTEFGQIAGMLEAVEAGETPLQHNLDKVGRRLAQACFAVVALIVVMGLLRQQPVLDMLVFGIALAVAVVPEALPAVVTISLAIGVQRMVKRNALVRRLPAVETLGSTTVICSDKTGTLTKDEMTVRRVAAGGASWEVGGAGYEPRGEFRREGRAEPPPAVVQRLLGAAALACDAVLRQDSGDDGGPPRWTIQGDPTEGALVVAAAKAGIDLEQLQQQYPRVDEIPFSSETKRMVTLHRGPGGRLASVKGAPEVVVPLCASRLTPAGTAEPLAPEVRREVLEAADALARQALRVLAIASRETDDRGEGQEQLTLLGLVGMIDPPREEAAQAVAACRVAGIRPVMITGDHPATARAIAAELGILHGGSLATGAELEAWSDPEYVRRAPDIDVYARVSPAHKLRIVGALQQLGHVVAMTGDGVNDAPALKKADIGIAMGITGTDVSKEAAAMTLTDDNFASIVAAVEEGRIVYGNIKKYLMYLLSSNIGEIGLMAGASFAGLPLPLTAVQLLYVNLATDGLPALALAVDPPEADLMQQKPRDPRQGIFTPSVVMLMVLGGVWSAITNLALFVWALRSGRPASEAVAMTFVSLILIQFYKAYSFRSDHLSLHVQPFANRWLNLAVLWELALLLLILYVPWLQRAFQTFPLTGQDWWIVAAISATIVPVLEFGKWLIRRRRAAGGG
jgi:Ca2+-transporting ATPase